MYQIFTDEGVPQAQMLNSFHGQPSLSLTVGGEVNPGYTKWNPNFQRVKDNIALAKHLNHAASGLP